MQKNFKHAERSNNFETQDTNLHGYRTQDRNFAQEVTYYHK